MTEISNIALLTHTTDIVAAYVSKNAVPVSSLPTLIRETHAQLGALHQGEEPRPEPAVPINRSIKHDHIICLEDGAKLKMLKRYLRTHYDMSPEEYRERWGLPADYPMVAPEYAKRRSEFAKKIGLGKK